MSKNEIALQLTLKAIEANGYIVPATNNEGVGRGIAEVFNAVLENLICDAESSETTAI